MKAASPGGPAPLPGCSKATCGPTGVDVSAGPAPILWATGDALDSYAIANMLPNVTSLTHLSAPTLAEQAYEALRRAIVAGELVRGQKVTERGLAELLNISPTPVREAIRRLEQDRLVERRGLREVIVREVDETEIADISLIEETLRGVAVRLAAVRATDSALAQMARALDAADDERRRLSGNTPTEDPSHDGVTRIWHHLREFHKLLDEACGSPMLLHMLAMADAFESGERRQVLRSEIQADPSAVDTRYNQHRAIYEAVRSHDAALAERLILDHGHSAAAARLEARGK